MYMEGASWYRVARDHGAILRPYMQLNKVYLHQMFSTCFAEFNTKDEALAFRKYADENIPYWDYDPVAVIDTSDSEVVERWKVHMEE